MDASDSKGTDKPLSSEAQSRDQEWMENSPVS